MFLSGSNYEAVLNFSTAHPLMKNLAGMVDRGTVNQVKKALASVDFSTKYQIAFVAYYAPLLYW
jgi:hypothetical protein